MFLKSKPVLPGPKQKNTKTGKLEDLELLEFEQILPTFETRAELSIDPYTGKLIRKPIEVLGQYWSEEKVSNTLINESIEHKKFDVLPDLGIIKFNEPIYYLEKGEEKINGKKTPIENTVPARLFAQIATPLKSLSGEPARYRYTEKIEEKFKAS